MMMAGWLVALLCACSRPASGPPPTSPPAGRACRDHTECSSGVCNHLKADSGVCAPESCRVGERTDNNHFFCNRQGRWEPTRPQGEPCQQDFMCFEPTCFMNPNCELGDRPTARCQQGVCVLVTPADPCSAKGWKRVLAAEEYLSGPEEGCVQSLAQRVLKTVCIPCGNGVCDPQESACNCPIDCVHK